jgi:membrane associated rhomboid family serine protease
MKGTYLLVFCRVDKNSIIVYCFFLFMNVAYALQPHSHIDLAGHVGGFIAGYLIGHTFLYHRKGQMKQVVALNLLLWVIMFGMFISIYLIEI